MAKELRPERPPPAWYQRLPPTVRKIAAASDRVPSLRLEPTAALVQAVADLPGVLAGARAAEVQVVAQRIADGICTAFRVPRVWVRVAERRPHDQRGELHGLYSPGVPPARDTVTLWMFTAKRVQVVAARTFIRTLLHELCHHLDYAHLGLRDSLHTQGFYQRESSLFSAVGADRIDSARTLR
jgi:hypothetical protein